MDYITGSQSGVQAASNDLMRPVSGNRKLYGAHLNVHVINLYLRVPGYNPWVMKSKMLNGDLFLMCHFLLQGVRV